MKKGIFLLFFPSDKKLDIMTGVTGKIEQPKPDGWCPCACGDGPCSCLCPDSFDPSADIWA